MRAHATRRLQTFAVPTAKAAPLVAAASSAFVAYGEFAAEFRSGGHILYARGHCRQTRPAHDGDDGDDLPESERKLTRPVLAAALGLRLNTEGGGGGGVGSVFRRSDNNTSKATGIARPGRFMHSGLQAGTVRGAGGDERERERP